MSPWTDVPGLPLISSQIHIGDFYSMEKVKKIGSEITVRISLTFQEAPDVHTLLAMTPVRARGKLVRLALEHYIQETGHIAGNVNVQIEAISNWLRDRDSASNVNLIPDAKISEKIQAQPVIEKNVDLNSAKLLANINRGAEIAASVEPSTENEKAVVSESASMKRWLDL